MGLGFLPFDTRPLFARGPYVILARENHTPQTPYSEKHPAKSEREHSRFWEYLSPSLEKWEHPSRPGGPYSGPLSRHVGPPVRPSVRAEGAHFRIFSIIFEKNRLQWR